MSFNGRALVGDPYMHHTRVTQTDVARVGHLSGKKHHKRAGNKWTPAGYRVVRKNKISNYTGTLLIAVSCNVKILDEPRKICLKMKIVNCV